MKNHSRKVFHHRRKILHNLASCCAGAFTMGGIAWLAQQSGLPLLIPSFGATCFIAFFLHESAFANPRNIIGGHLFSTIAGLICLTFLGAHWWVYGLSVGFAMLVMKLTNTMHPPAAGNPLFILLLAPASWIDSLLPIMVCSLILAFAAHGYRQFAVYQTERSQKDQALITSTENLL